MEESLWERNEVFIRRQWRISGHVWVGDFVAQPHDAQWPASRQRWMVEVAGVA